MKKICFITAARSEYGLLKWLMRDVCKHNKFDMQLVVTGGHLLEEQGHTIDQIIEDGFVINEIVDADLDISSVQSIAESLGRMTEGFSKTFDRIRPDSIVVLGDRYELLAVCSVALIMNIPIIHIGGGDVTDGAIDNEVRNAVTMMSNYHFPGTKASAENIIRMRGSDKNVWIVGELGLDSFYREPSLSRGLLAEDLGIDPNKRWCLMTYHSETRESIEYNLECVENCINELLELDEFITVITYANADYGGKQINNYIEMQGKMYSDKIKVVPSLGHSRYLSYMKQVELVIGNSSSGIIEAPFLNIPVINIGNRQKGRYLCENVLQCESTREAIRAAILTKLDTPKTISKDLNYWGNGRTSERIITIMESIL